MMSRIPIVVLAGPSGVGKTTIAERLIAEPPIPLRRAVTATTRNPRPGERPEIDYHFWTRERFRDEIAARRMLEWAEVHGSDLYGTPKSEVESRPETTLLVIDVQGAAQVRAARLPHISIFLQPPSIEELESRLRNRGEAQEKIERRLMTARQEILRAEEFDYRVENREIDDTVRILKDLILTA